MARSLKSAWDRYKTTVLDKKFGEKVNALERHADYLTSGPQNGLLRVGVDSGTLNRSLGTIKIGKDTYRMGWQAPYATQAIGFKNGRPRGIINAPNRLALFWRAQF